MSGRYEGTTFELWEPYSGDFMATAAELAKTKTPRDIDSISFAPALFGRNKQRQHEFLYWEFHERGFSQAALYRGRWKGLRVGNSATPLELYDLATDIGETKNVAAANPKIVAKLEAYLRTARRESVDWPITSARANP